jgi:hypothetical protein
MADIGRGFDFGETRGETGGDFSFSMRVFELFLRSRDAPARIRTTAADPHEAAVSIAVIPDTG